MLASLDSAQWIHGSPSCAESTDPRIQIHEVDLDTYALRVSKCFSFEGNFLYLLFGRERAILLDTGPRPDSGAGAVLPVRRLVDKIVASYLDRENLGTIDLIVAHTHAHGDHTSWDGAFKGRSRTQIVRLAPSDVAEFFGLPDWPEGRAHTDLGGRSLTVFPIPGHEDSHIAVYDPALKILLTGDTLYPGLLTVRDWPAFLQSSRRLAAFAESHDIEAVVGAHIELTTEPGKLYPIGTTFQPAEHTLALSASHIHDLCARCEAMANHPHRDIQADFIIEPV